MPKNCLHCRSPIDTVKRPRSKMCSKRCWSSWYDAQPHGRKRRSRPRIKPSQRPTPILETATIVLSTTGKLRWVRCLHLVPDNRPDPYDAHAARWEELEDEKRRWLYLALNARYLWARKFTTTDEPVTRLNLPQENQHQNEQ